MVWPQRRDFRALLGATPVVVVEEARDVSIPAPFIAFTAFWEQILAQPSGSRADAIRCVGP